MFAMATFYLRNARNAGTQVSTEASQQHSWAMLQMCQTTSCQVDLQALPPQVHSNT